MAQVGHKNPLHFSSLWVWSGREEDKWSGLTTLPIKLHCVIINSVTVQLALLRPFRFFSSYVAVHSDRCCIRPHALCGENDSV